MDAEEFGLYYVNAGHPKPHRRLVFPISWIGTVLPKQWEAENPDQTMHFEVTLVDTEDNGKEYKSRMWPSYEQVFPKDVLTTVSLYMFLQHFCPCHRKIAAGGAGADTDEECEGERFQIKSITAPNFLPGLDLLTETRRAAGDLDGISVNWSPIEVLDYYEPGRITGDAAALARYIFASRSWEQFPILADALEDSQFPDRVALERLRKEPGHSWNYFVAWGAAHPGVIQRPERIGT